MDNVAQREVGRSSCYCQGRPLSRQGSYREVDDNEENRNDARDDGLRMHRLVSRLEQPSKQARAHRVELGDAADAIVQLLHNVKAGKDSPAGGRCGTTAVLDSKARFQGAQQQSHNGHHQNIAQGGCKRSLGKRGHVLVMGVNAFSS